MDDAPEQSTRSWRTRLAAQATKAVKSVAPLATQQQVRLAVKTIRATPRAVATAQAARIKKAEAAPPVTDQHVTPSEKPGAAFRATQAVKAAEVLKATLARETVVCPACSATVEMSAVRCRCGYSLCEVQATLAKDRDLKRSADNLGDSLSAIYATADIPKVD